MRFHITGYSDQETFFGLGYVHAQERLWQMTYLKRISQGRLSEISGSETVLLDSFMKSLDLQTIAANFSKFDSRRKANFIILFKRR